MGCIDDPDISIRLQALDLGAGMVSSDNLVDVVERLMQQLRSAPASTRAADDGRSHVLGVEPAADSDGEDPEETLRPTAEPQDDTPALPTEYRITLIRQILAMCARDTYANVNDFEWYIDILVQLVRMVPAASYSPSGLLEKTAHNFHDAQEFKDTDVASAIGWELRNVAVRVNTVRAEAVKAANSLMAVSGSNTSSTLFGIGGEGVLVFAAWVAGEYVTEAAFPYSTLDSLVHGSVQSLPPTAISAYLQAIPKVLASVVSHETSDWSSERKAMMSLLVARVVHFLEPLTTHPNLEVQERSVEFLELMRVVSQAITGHDADNDQGPLLLTIAIPQLFRGFELNPVAPTAQRKVPLPASLNLDMQINQNISGLLQRADQEASINAHAADFEAFYNQRPKQQIYNAPVLDSLPSVGAGPTTYQQSREAPPDVEAALRKRNDRRERNKDDPFYIGSDDYSSGTSTPFQDILKSANGQDVDVDSIPIMDLDLGDKSALHGNSSADAKRQKRKRPKKVEIAKDENIDVEDSGTDQASHRAAYEMVGTTSHIPRIRDRAKKSLLEVDSSVLSSFSLSNTDNAAGRLDVERQDAQDAEMAKALAQVERLRLEMQRASERIQATDGTPSDGTLVKKKKKKKPKHSFIDAADPGEQALSAKAPQGSQDGGTVPEVKKKRRIRKPPISQPYDEAAIQVDEESS